MSDFLFKSRDMKQNNSEYAGAVQFRNKSLNQNSMPQNTYSAVNYLKSNGTAQLKSELPQNAENNFSKSVQMKSPVYASMHTTAPAFNNKANYTGSKTIQMAPAFKDKKTTHKGLRLKGDTLEYDKSSKFAEQLKAFEGSNWVKISHMSSKEIKDYCEKNSKKLILTPPQLKASFELAEAKSNKANHMGFFTEEELNKPGKELTPMAEIQNASKTQKTQNTQDAINFFEYSNSNTNEKGKEADLAKSIIGENEQTVVYTKGKIKFNEFDENKPVYSGAFSGCTMAVFRFKRDTTISGKTYDHNIRMVAHVDKELTDKFYYLIDNDIIKDVSFFVPNSNADKSTSGRERFVGKIYSDNNHTLKAESHKYYINMNGSYNFNEEAKKMDLISAKKDEKAQDKFNNLLKMMTGALFVEGNYYHVSQFSDDVIKKGLDGLQEKSTTYDGVTSGIWNAPKGSLPKAVIKWCDEKKIEYKK